MPLMARFASLDFAAANALMIGEFFGGIDARAALPDLLGVVDMWKPDLLLRESWEFAATIVAELRGIPLARVGLGLASVEDMSLRTAAPVVDKIRVGNGLPADPAPSVGAAGAPPRLAQRGTPALPARPEQSEPGF